jgi:hypothetical protein
LCISTVLTDTHATTGATGIGTATGLPAGVTAAFARIPLQLVVHQLYQNIQLYYSTDRWMWRCECNRNDYSNTKQHASAASTTPTLCISTVLTDTIMQQLSNGNRHTGLPAGVTAAFASNTITISGTPTVSGTFNYTIPLTGGCGAVNATGTITKSNNSTYINQHLYNHIVPY